MAAPRYLVILSEKDPVAALVGEGLPSGEATGESVEGTPIRRIAQGVLLLRRPGLHIYDEHLDRHLPTGLRSPGIPLVFPSVHRSERGVRCFTVHSLGNVGEAEVGGERARLNPAAPRLATDALRRMHEAGGELGLPATYEATHHGPALDLPSMFAEIGFAEDDSPPAEAARALARILPVLQEDERDHVVVGVGGGHYAPHFTDLALKRRWAFGHILSRHALADADPKTIESAGTLTPGSEGYVFHRASDALEVSAQRLRPRLSEGHAPRRDVGPASERTTSAGLGSGPGVGT
ncbi:MAG: D-aminoacyl-tRNA deacylase [Thermoplasmata archaeon]|nr:D-aminoacyl-tRNA deacylase [Thermoplasmata archaeon]MCI4359466.1 D-aminoacyl-tRNA deacylase [Thermoplasmata archaeon]